MPKFRKKPVVIEARKWNGSDSYAGSIEGWLTCNHRAGKDTLVIETLEGDMLADKGDWIIKGIAGEFYPCKPDIFEKTYEEIV